MGKIEKIAPILLVAIYAGLLLLFKWDYLPKSLLASTGLLTLPFMAWQVSGKRSNRYGWAGPCFGLVVGHLPQQYVVLVLHWLCRLVLLGSFSGQDELPARIAAGGFVARFSVYLRYMELPYPLENERPGGWFIVQNRLRCQAKGNIIALGGYDFQVDAACMGLHPLAPGCC